MSGNVAFRVWLGGLFVTVMAVLASMAYVDRPLAEFLERHVRHTQFWLWLEVTLRPLSLVAVAAMLFLLGCGIFLASGGRLGSWTQLPLLCAWAVVLGVATEIIFKRIFGRAWPDPTFVRDHAYGFHFLHGQTHWDSFPSGTAIVSSALLSVLWDSKPHWRLPGALIVLLLLIGVIVGNFHWLSDVIGGVFVGVTVGWSTKRLISRNASDGGGETRR